LPPAATHSAGPELLLEQAPNRSVTSAINVFIRFLLFSFVCPNVIALTRGAEGPSGSTPDGRAPRAPGAYGSGARAASLAGERPGEGVLIIVHLPR